MSLGDGRCTSCGNTPGFHCRKHFVADLAQRDRRIAELEALLCSECASVARTVASAPANPATLANVSIAIESATPVRPGAVAVLAAPASPAPCFTTTPEESARRLAETSPATATKCDCEDVLTDIRVTLCVDSNTPEVDVIEEIARIKQIADSATDDSLDDHT